MGSNRKLMFGVLLVVGAVVVWGLFSVISRFNAPPSPTPAPLTAKTVSLNNGRLIARATTDIPQGSIVTKDMFEMVPLAGSGLTTGFVTNPEAQAIGYITREDIPKGAQLRPADDFVGHISEVGIAGALRPGTRAMVIAFANKPTLHDLVRIGNFVDINAAFDGQEARTIVSGVRVLAVDVFGNDYPQVNIAVRGPYKADAKGAIANAPAPSTNGVPADPNAAPTATPAPAQAPARPDPAITLEVTPAQANTILLAQASGGTLDFVVLPALPGNRTNEPLAVPGTPIGEGGIGSGTAAAPIRSVSVTRAQIAPYAERKKSAGNNGGAVRNASTGGNGGGSGTSRRPIRETFTPPSGMGNPGVNPIPTSVEPALIPTPTAVPPSPTYDIPIYADGKAIRVETVRRPQE